MKIYLLSFFLVTFQQFAFAQQFQLEATIDKRISRIFDMDGDGICEYVADTNKVYDGATHLLKYTFPGTDLEWDDAATAQSTNYNFPHIDFNSDGKRDLIILNDNFIAQDGTFIVFDIINNTILFEFNPPERYVSLQNLIDIDGDGELELVIYANEYVGGTDIHKTYIYSTGVPTSALEETYSAPPTEYKLKQNFPNPFNPSTTIRYTLSGPENISIKIYDVSGQLVKEIYKEHNQAGEYEVIWDGTNKNREKVSSGTYFYQLSVGNYNEAKKMMLLK